jgi:hypothetical protein
MPPAARIISSAPRSIGASLSAPVAMPLVVAVVVLGVGAFAPSVFDDGDTWWHIAAGQWTLAHGAVPRVDPFSFTMPGAPWTAHEWLSEVFLALAYQSAGLSGVALLTGAAAGLTAFIVASRVARDLSGIAFALVMALCLAMLTMGLFARPHLLALPVAAAWTAGLLAARDSDRAPSLLLLPLMTLWANMHGGFAFGLALIAPFALEALLASERHARTTAALQWGRFAALAVIAALITPHGVEGLLFPLRLLAMANTAHIREWQPASFSSLSPFEIAVLVLLGFALLGRLRVPVVRLALLIGLIHLSLQHFRHEMLLAVVAPMLLAGPIAGSIEARPGAGLRDLSALAAGLAAASAAAIVILRLVWPLPMSDGPGRPVRALAAIPQELREKPVLNDYDFGGYLIFAKIRPYIDGRADMFGDDYLSDYARITAADPEAVDKALARYGVAWTIFAPEQRVVEVMDRRPGWRRLYADEFAVVHVRSEALGAANVEKGEK